MAHQTFPKPRPVALERKDRRTARKAADEAENKIVRARSGGRCQLVERYIRLYPCMRRAVHIHHRLPGIGVRGRGKSALAENKLHLCIECHRDIHSHVLVPDGEYFRRIK